MRSLSRSCLLLLVFLALVATLVGCGEESAKTIKRNPYESAVNYFTKASRLRVEVAFEQGRAPFTETQITLSNGAPFPLWQITEENLVALFLGRPNAPEVLVPKTLAEMHELPAFSKSSWTAEEIYALAEKHRRHRSSAQESAFWVVFLGGQFRDGSQSYPSMVGVSLGGTTVVAIFKDVVLGTGSDVGLTTRYVEQATVVHELGHALGLVDNGIAMHQDHRDREHGKHCTASACVMYWLNEGRADMVAFVTRMLQERSVVMFDDKCLEDGRKFLSSAP